MDRHKRQGCAANIVAFVLEGCITSGLVDEALRTENLRPEEIQEIKDELQIIATEHREKARLHKSMEPAIKVRQKAK